jgi:hypothetical protein
MRLSARALIIALGLCKRMIFSDINQITERFIYEAIQNRLLR